MTLAFPYIRPVWKIMAPLTLTFWAIFVYTGLFGPASWFESDTLAYVRVVDQAAWAIAAVPIVVCLIVGFLQAKFRVVRVGLGIGVLLSTFRFLLITLTVADGQVQGINALAAWFFVAGTHYAMATARIVPDSR